MTDRRAFLKKGISRLLVAVGLTFLAYPILSFMTFRKSRNRKVVFHAGDMASPVNYKDGVYLIIQREEIYALSARCTHLGCTLTYDGFSRKFRCPCHGSVFALSGKRVEGPAKKDLDRVPVNREQNGEFVVILAF